jgi:hypothetical protein
MAATVSAVDRPSIGCVFAIPQRVSASLTLIVTVDGHDAVRVRIPG